MTTVKLRFTLGKSDQVIQARRAGEILKTGSKAGIQPPMPTSWKASSYVAGWNFHPLKGELAGHWAVKVNGNWRMIFAFDGQNAILVDYLDCH